MDNGGCERSEYLPPGKSPPGAFLEETNDSSRFRRKGPPPRKSNSAFVAPKSDLERTNSVFVRTESVFVYQEWELPGREGHSAGYGLRQLLLYEGSCHGERFPSIAGEFKHGLTHDCFHDGPQAAGT